MTEPKLKADKEAGNLSETTKSYLIDLYVQEKFGREQDIFSKYITKGLMVEEDAITLYSRVKKTFHAKNELKLENDFIKGTPDLYSGETIQNATEVIDIKSSWDIFTFYRNFVKDVPAAYYWQLQGYMALTGAKVSRLAFCLVDTPDVMINDEKRKLMWKMGVATDMDDAYIEAAEQLDRLMKYSDIPMQQRVCEFVIERNDADIERLYAKVSKAREYLCYLETHIDEETNTIKGGEALPS
jgi:hypothetical protein